MIVRYTPQNVCAEEIQFKLDKGIVSNVKFKGGCPGNTLGIARLVNGMSATDVIEKLEFVPCGKKSKTSSCPDQLAIALIKEVRKREKKNKKNKV